MTDGMGDNLGVLETKLDGLQLSVDAMGGKLNSIAHVLYEGNGNSILTRMALVERQCGESCPQASALALRVKIAEAALDGRKQFQRIVVGGLIIACFGGVGSLAVALIQALSRAGVHL